MSVDNIIIECENELGEEFRLAEEVALFNQEKVLNAFRRNRISATHFNGTSGYGYDDLGRNALSRVFADVFCSESAIVSPFFASGTHAIATALRGILRPQMSLLSITGKPYDTLEAFFFGEGINSLKDFWVRCETIEAKLNSFDFDAVSKYLQKSKPDVVYIQRSGGYSKRAALCIDATREAVSLVKELSPKSIVFVDNCYGEFVEKVEPLEVGADIAVGSLIKNPGGGLAPSGAYIAGKEKLINEISYMMTAPQIGNEIGSYTPGYREFFQGFFMAPHTVLQAVKSALLFSRVLKKVGYTVTDTAKRSDIICAVDFPNDKTLIKFCQTIQSFSPVDSYVTPMPWDMPGYSHNVIMAAGCFIQGSSIELSCDAPIKPPYTAYIQGGLTYEHSKIVLTNCLKTLVME